MKIKVRKIYENKKVRYATTLLAGAVVLGLGFYGLYRMTRPSVGIVDFTIAQGKAKLYQSVIAEQRKYEDEIRARIAADSVGLEKEAKELEAKKNTIKPEEYQKKALSIQRRFLTIQEKYRPSVERIVAASQLALKGAEKEIAQAVEQTARQTGVKVLLPVNNVLYADKKADMTDAFVKNLDKLIVSVPYPDPAKLGE